MVDSKMKKDCPKRWNESTSAAAVVVVAAGFDFECMEIIDYS